MKYFLLLALSPFAAVSSRAADDPCAPYLKTGYQRDVFIPAWTARASPQAKRFLASYSKSAGPKAALEMQCLISVGLARVIKNENDSTVEWARDHKNIRPSKGQDELDAAGDALRRFKKGKDMAHLSPSDEKTRQKLMERARQAKDQLSKYKGLCNEWTQSVCSAFVFPARHHSVRWIEIRWEGLDVNEATHNMVAICPKEVENPFAARGRCLLIDAWRNLDPDHDFYAFYEYHNLGVSRSMKSCPEGKNLPL